MPTAAAISIGNSTLQAGHLLDGVLDGSVTVPADRPRELVDAIEPWFAGIDRDERASLLASVNEPAAKALRALLADRIGGEIIQMEDDLAAPIGRGLDPESVVGVDRLLAASAAWNELKQACIVIDAGTAITVDFVDGEGVFQGGAIMPGVAAMLHTMAMSTNLLPDEGFKAPEGEPWGRNTVDVCGEACTPRSQAAHGSSSSDTPCTTADSPSSSPPAVTPRRSSRTTNWSAG